jgi:hypothetical protein
LQRRVSADSVHGVISRRPRARPRSSATRLWIDDSCLSAEIVDLLGRAGWIAEIAPDGAVELATQAAGGARAIGWRELENLLKVLALMYPGLGVELGAAAPELEPV